MKIKHNGITLRVRECGFHEIIKSGYLYQNSERGKYFRTKSEGDKVADHPDRKYFEVLSRFYK